MVSLKKSIVCADEGKVLGHCWHSGGYFTAEGKGLKALLELPHEQLAELPRASVYGLLSYFVHTRLILLSNLSHYAVF